MKRRSDAIIFHLEKDNNLLEDVNVLINNDRFTSILSRLYYACFHATSALLLTKDLTSKTHKGLQVLLQKHFVETGVLPSSEAKLFARLFEERMDDDYGDFYIADKDDVISFIMPAKEFINTIESIIKNNEHN